MDKQETKAREKEEWWWDRSFFFAPCPHKNRHGSRPVVALFVYDILGLLKA